MSFQKYLQKEQKIRRYTSLISKYFDGKSLQERTALNRNLARFCEGELAITQDNINYCFSKNEPQNCSYQELQGNQYVCKKAHHRTIENMIDEQGGIFERFTLH